MVPIYPDLNGKHVLITGGAGGIGAAVVEAFVQQRCRISILDKDIEAATSLIKRLDDRIVFHCVAGLSATLGPEYSIKLFFE